MKITPKNGHILVKEVVRKEDEKSTEAGIIIAETILDDEQASKGLVIEGNEEFPKGVSVIFHKVVPIDVHLKLEGDTEPTLYFFVGTKDVICTIEE